MTPPAPFRVINMQAVEVDVEFCKQLQLLYAHKYAHINGTHADAGQHKRHCNCPETSQFPSAFDLNRKARYMRTPAVCNARHYTYGRQPPLAFREKDT